MKIDAQALLTQMESQMESKSAADEAAGFKEKLKEAAASGDREALEKVAADFESLFVHQILKSMRQSGGTEGFIEKSHARKIFEEMFDEKMAERIGGVGDMGIAKMIVDSFEKEEENIQPSFDEKG